VDIPDALVEQRVKLALSSPGKRPRDRTPEFLPPVT
jgi:hypothetical protein